MKKYLDIAMDIGEQMLLCGAEVNRVEDSMSRILTAFGSHRVDVFIITTSMVVTIHDAENKPFTQTRRIMNTSGTDFDKLSKLNALSRKICLQKEHNLDDIKTEILSILNSKNYPLYLEFIFYSVIAGVFTLFFGSIDHHPLNLLFVEALLSMIIGFSVRFVVLFCDKFIKNKIFTKFMSSFVATALAFLIFNLNLVSVVDYLIIGNIMVLIPGVGLTNSLRDLFVGDSMTGVLRFIEAILTAIAIALGYVVFVVISGGIALWRLKWLFKL